MDKHSLDENPRSNLPLQIFVSKNLHELIRSKNEVGRLRSEVNRMTEAIKKHEAQSLVLEDNIEKALIKLGKCGRTVRFVIKETAQVVEIKMPEEDERDEATFTIHEIEGTIPL
jgi:hypothetical protein